MRLTRSSELLGKPARKGPKLAHGAAFQAPAPSYLPRWCPARYKAFKRDTAKSVHPRCLRCSIQVASVYTPYRQ